MKALNTYISEWKLTNDSKDKVGKYHPKTFEELWDIVYSMYQEKEKILDLRNIDVSQIEILSGKQAMPRAGKSFNLTGLFAYFINVEVIDVTGWNVSKVKDISYMFYECENLKKIKGIDDWDTTNIVDMGYLFENCYNLKEFPIWYDEKYWEHY